MRLPFFNSTRSGSKQLGSQDRFWLRYVLIIVGATSLAVILWETIGG